MINKTLTTIATTAAMALLCLSFHAPLYAGVYKWVDQDGQLHYGDRPGKADAEEVTIRNNETTKPRPIKNTEDGDKNTQGAKPAEKPAKPEKPAISKKEKRRLCNEAKTDIATITSRGRMREKNAKGEYIYLSEKQRQQRLAAAKKKQREFCR